MSRETIVSDNGNNQLIPIITTKNGKLEFQEDNLTRLLDQEILKDTPIAIVSIAGKKRLGKSLFLNLLLRYLKKRGWESNTDDWLTGWNSSMHDGFVARGGDDPVTTGIIAWGEPIFVHCPEKNKEIAIILLDTEGTFDTANRNTSVGIFALSTLSSSLQIFNIDKRIILDDLDYLKYFTKQARVVAQNRQKTDVDSGRSNFGNPSRFQNLAFLVRNWSNPDRSYGLEGGEEHMKHELAKFVESNDHNDIVDGRHPIYDAFQGVSCFLMPEPGETVRVRGKNGPILKAKDLGDNFRSFTTTFAREYLHPDRLPTKAMKAEHLLTFLKQCAKRIEEGCLPELRDIDELMAQVVIQKAVKKAIDTFLSTIEKFIEDAERPGWKSFNDTVKQQKQLVTNNFRSEVRLYVSEVTLEAEVRKMQQTLDEKIGNELIKKMQKKIIPYAKKEAVDIFVSTVKTKIKEMGRVIWENFDETIRTQTAKMEAKFLEDVLLPDTNVNLENDKIDLKNMLKEKASGCLRNFMLEERKQYVSDKSKKSLHEAKEELKKYSNTLFPIPFSGTKEIRKKCTKNLEILIEKDDRDPDVIQDTVVDMEAHVRGVARSADAAIVARYAAATGTACLLIFNPVAAAASFVAVMAFTKDTRYPH